VVAGAPLRVMTTFTSLPICVSVAAPLSPELFCSCIGTVTDDGDIAAEAGGCRKREKSSPAIGRVKSFTVVQILWEGDTLTIIVTTEPRPVCELLVCTRRELCGIVLSIDLAADDGDAAREVLRGSEFQAKSRAGASTAALS